MGFVAKEAGRIAYLEREGEGEVPLVLLHGIGSNAASFEALLPALPECLPVIAWNAPGYGDSIPLSTDWPVAADYALALRAFFDALEIHRAVVFGHSLGSLMGAALARMAPERIAQLILASTALGHGVKPGGVLSEGAQSRIDDLLVEGAEAFAARRAPRLVFAPETNPDLVAFVTRSMAAVRMPGYAHAARMLASGRLLDDLAKTAVPVSVIFGTEDVVTPPDANRQAYSAVPPPFRGKLIATPDAGHALYQQAPTMVADAIRAVFEMTDSGTAGDR